MLEAVFKQILNMSITASVVICLVLAMRFVLRKYPKKYSYVLWILAGFRLICPVSFSSVISIFNLGAFRKAADVLETMEEAPAAYTGAVENKAQQTAAAGAALENVQGKAAAVQEYAQQAPDYWRIAAALWIAGMLVFLLYHLYTCLKTGRLLRTAVKAEKSTDFPQEDGGLSPDYEVFECGAIVSPFVWGLLSPKIYIPFGLEGKQLTYILAHEQFHIRRRDNLAKLLAVALLTVYWFNPVIWLAFYAFSLDMEMSCDEAVIGALDAGGKKEYCQSLVSLAEKRRLLSVGPLAFGESGIGKRIKNILHFRKPLPWVALCIAIVLVGIAGVTLSDASGVGAKQADTARDLAIIDDFLNGTYAYTKTVHLFNSSSMSTETGVYYGKMIAEPYQQIEEGDSDIEYIYEKDGTIYWNRFDEALTDVSDGWVRDIGSMKKEDLASEGNYLKFVRDCSYDHEEEVDGISTAVYYAQCDTSVSAQFGENQMERPCKLHIYYYVDTQAQQVIRVKVDLREQDQAFLIFEKMAEGVSEEDAVAQAEFGDDVETSSYVYDIYDYGADIEIEDPRPDEQETEDLISEKRRETLETVLTTVFTAPNPELTPVAAYIGLDAEPGTEPENASGASDAFINWDEAVGSYFMDGRLEKFLNESAGIGIQMEAAEENKAFSYVGMEIIEETDFHITCTVRYTIDDEEYQTTAQAWYDSETSARIKDLILDEIH